MRSNLAERLAIVCGLVAAMGAGGMQPVLVAARKTATTSPEAPRLHPNTTYVPPTAQMSEMRGGGNFQSALDLAHPATWCP
jgi:hypothetical protein